MSDESDCASRHVLHAGTGKNIANAVAGCARPVDAVHVAPTSCQNMCIPSAGLRCSSRPILQRFSTVLSNLGVSRNRRIAVALSGGSDSMALALLTAWWRQARGAAGSPSTSLRHPLLHPRDQQPSNTWIRPRMQGVITAHIHLTAAQTRCVCQLRTLSALSTSKAPLYGHRAGILPTPHVAG